MFNLKKNKNTDNPLSDIFKNLSQNQKMSIINLLLSTALIDGEKGNRETEAKYLNSYLKILNLKRSHCMDYLKNQGQEQIRKDLINLSTDQKEMLAIITYELMTCDGRVNEEEIIYISDFFENIDISSKKYSEIVQKAIAFKNQFS